MYNLFIWVIGSCSEYVIFFWIEISTALGLGQAYPRGGYGGFGISPYAGSYGGIGSTGAYSNGFGSEYGSAFGSYGSYSSPYGNRYGSGGYGGYGGIGGLGGYGGGYGGGFQY